MKKRMIFDTDPIVGKYVDSLKSLHVRFILLLYLLYLLTDDGFAQNVALDLGDEDNNYELTIRIQIEDQYFTYTETSLTLTVSTLGKPYELSFYVLVYYFTVRSTSVTLTQGGTVDQ